MEIKNLLSWLLAAQDLHEKEWTEKQVNRSYLFKTEMLMRTIPPMIPKAETEIARFLLENCWNDVQEWAAALGVSAKDHTHLGEGSTTPETKEGCNYFEEVISQLRVNASLHDSDGLTLICQDGDPAVATIRSGDRLSIFIQNETLDTMVLQHSRSI